MSDIEDGEERRSAGRPTKYDPDFCRQALVLAKLGATDGELAEAFDVTKRTIINWRADHDEFRQACEIGKDIANDRVERSLYERAVGYSHEATKIFYNSRTGQTVCEPYIERFPPDTAACFIWLKNRKSHEWRDRHEITGANGGPMHTLTTTMPLTEAMQVYAQLVSSEGGPQYDEETPPGHVPDIPDQS
jgi:hypothetical protein